MIEGTGLEIGAMCASDDVLLKVPDVNTACPHEGWRHPNTFGELMDALIERRVVVDFDRDLIVWAMPLVDPEYLDEETHGRIEWEGVRQRHSHGSAYSFEKSMLIVAEWTYENFTPNEARRHIYPRILDRTNSRVIHSTRWRGWLVEMSESAIAKQQQEVINEVRERLGMEE